MTASRGLAPTIIGLTLAGALLGLTRAADGDKAAPDAWKFDLVILKNGSTWRGLIVDEKPELVRFQNVRRQPGRPTHVFTTSFARAEIDRIEKLTEADREVLKARLKELDPSGQAERQRMEQLALETIAWDGQPGAGRRYRSEYFTLESDAPESIVRRTAVRLEQIYDAYARYLPPRGDLRRAASIVLLHSQAEYQTRLKAERLSFVNVAYYNPARNQIVCASDLEELGQDLERARLANQQLRADLDRREAALNKLYRNPKEFARHVQPIRETRKRIDMQDRQNEGVFDQATRQLFSVLYHEAFHAYLAGCVFPPPSKEPPRWLNEGLAQIFETAIVEAGELRLGHADPDRLSRVKEALRKNELVPVEQLLRAEDRQFQAAHAGDRSTTGQYYLTAWAVAFHLTFERRLLGTAALDRYVASAGADPFAAFTMLVGSSLGQYEQELRRYIAVLQPDGSTNGHLTNTADKP